MKKHFFSVLLTLMLSIVSIYPQAVKTINNSSWFFTVKQDFGFKSGQMNEIVLQQNKYNLMGKLSELNWEVTPELYVGLELETGWKFLSLSTRVTTMATDFGRNGKMYDSDWAGLTWMQTNYSISQNDLLYDWSIDSKINFTFNPISTLFAALYVGVSYSDTSFSANWGYGWYGDSNSTGLGYNSPYWVSAAKFYGPGSLYGVDYCRKNINVLLGTTASYTFWNRLELKVDVAVAPFTYIYSNDTHYGRMYYVYYLDQPMGYFQFFDFGLSASYKITQRLSVGAKYSISFLNQIEGRSSVKNSFSFYYTYTNTTQAAASGYMNDFNIFVKYAF